MQQLFKRVVGRFYKSDVASKPSMPNGRPAEVFFVDTRRFACDGPNFSKHPRVWLTIADGDDQTFCPYCSRLFKID
jgi:uncharacterized Zn-finger protein|tara:strand:+ start:164497 stop:164724 length:228 start_codon:yes stop_codon:yes gene_type:complete